MMEPEEMETLAPDYVQGFNEGYTIAQHMPELADKLASAMPEDERGQGFKDGREEMTKERFREKHQALLNGKAVVQAADKSPDKTQDGPDLDR